MIHTRPVLGGARVAVVVPAYREERLLARTLLAVPALVDAIWVVDDASDDRTWQVATSVASPRLRRVRHARNRGVGAAIATGYQRALADAADVIAVMAGDAQMHPGDLGAVIEPVALGRADYVKGNRFVHPLAARMPLERRLGGRLLSALTRAATGLRVDDTQCGYTAISARAARALPLDELWPRYGYPNDLLALLARDGWRIAEVPVRPVYAGEASGVRPWHVVSIAGVVARRAARSGAAGRRAAQHHRLRADGDEPA
jgi:glycosyltransferase involved in cell wall biosynthesis